MHETSYRLMDEELNLYPGHPAKVLDVASYDVNGSYRPLVEGRGWAYTGLDIRPGPNVDVVASNPYQYPFEDKVFDVCICGNALHNFERPWLAVPEMARVLKPGGMLIIITVHTWPQGSNYPKDYWRVQRDGLEALFEMTERLELIYVRVANAHDLIGRAFRKEVDPLETKRVEAMHYIAQLRADLEQAVFPGWQSYEEWIANGRTNPKAREENGE